MPPSEPKNPARRWSALATPADFLGIFGACVAMMGCAESKLSPPEAPHEVPTDVQRLQSLEGENRRLVDKLAAITAERDALKAGRIPSSPCAPPSSDKATTEAVTNAPQASDKVDVPPAPPSRIAIVVEGEEPGRVIEMSGDEPTSSSKEGAAGSKRKPSSAKATPESSPQKR